MFPVFSKLYRPVIPYVFLNNCFINVSFYSLEDNLKYNKSFYIILAIFKPP